MRKILIAALAVGTAFGSAQTAEVPPITPLSATDQRIMVLLEYRQRREDAQMIFWNFGIRAGIKRPMVLAVSSNCTTACVDIGTSAGAVYVLVDDAALFLDPPMVEAFLAHEVGHVVAGHVERWKTLSSDQKAACEKEADAYSMHLLGEARYREYLASTKVPQADIERTIAQLKRIPVKLPPSTVKSLI